MPDLRSHNVYPRIMIVIMIMCKMNISRKLDNKGENGSKMCREKEQQEKWCGLWEVVFSVPGILLPVRPEYSALFPHLKICLSTYDVVTRLGNCLCFGLLCIYLFLLLYQEAPVVSPWRIKKEMNHSSFLTDDKKQQLYFQWSDPMYSTRV